MTTAETVRRWSDAELVARVREHMSGCADCDEVKLVAQELIDRMATVTARCRSLERKLGVASLFDALYVAMYGANSATSVSVLEREALAQLAEGVASALTTATHCGRGICSSFDGHPGPCEA